MEDENRCRNCASVIPPGAAFCPACGAPRSISAPEVAGDRPSFAAVEMELRALRRHQAELDQQLHRLEAHISAMRSISAAPIVEPATRPPAPVEVAPVEAVAAPRPRRHGLFDLGTAEPVPVPGPLPAPPSPVSAAVPAAEPAEQPEQAVPHPQRPASTESFEAMISERLLAWVGGLSLVLGAVFFLSLAFSRGWIGPSARVVIGLAGGTLLLGLGGWFFERREALLGHVLVASGLGINSISLFAATRLYELIPVYLALAGTLIMAVAAAVIAIRANTQIVATYGLIAALAAPPVLGAVPNGTTVAYVSVILIGTTLIALYRAWRILPPIAFVLAVPQISDWVVNTHALIGPLIALAGFWAVNAVASGGEEFRIRRNVLSPISAILLLANAAYLISAGFTVLDGSREGWRGTFLLVTALAHFALGGYFLRAEGERHPFGLLATGTGLAALTMAVPVQFGGPWVPLAWAAEATALAWIYAERRNGFSGGAAIVLGALAIGHVVIIEYPLTDISRGQPSHYPFINGAGGTVAFLLGALLVAAWFLRSRDLRGALGTIGLLLVSYALPFELSGLWLLGAWSGLFVLSVVFARRVVPFLPYYAEPIEPAAPVTEPEGTAGALPVEPRDVLDQLPIVPILVTGGLALAHALSFDLPVFEKFPPLPATPFTDTYTVAAVILIITSLLAGFLAGGLRARVAGVLAAVASAAYLMPFELKSAPMVIAWAALALGLGLLTRIDRHATPAFLVGGAVLLGFGLAETLSNIAPPARLFVRSGVLIDHPLFWSSATVTLGVIIIDLVVGYYLAREWLWSPVIALLAGSLTVYLLSVGLVDEFQGRILGPRALEELQKQAQVGISILWAVIGVAVFIAGINRVSPAARLFGLALLTLTTAKVFVYDLASLDAAYRVLSFIGLGLLLLLGAYAYQHFAPSDDVHKGGHRLSDWLRKHRPGSGEPAG